MESPKSSKRMKTQTQTNFLDLPPELMIQIFIKVGVVDLLCNAQYVCSSWRTISTDPQLYQFLDMSQSWEYFVSIVLQRRFANGSLQQVPRIKDIMGSTNRMVTRAIDRGGDAVVEFSMTYCCNNVILQELGDKSPRLKCLRLDMCYQVSYDCWTQLIQKLPLLEELELCLCFFPKDVAELNDPAELKDVIEVVGRFCPNLKAFRLNCKGKWLSPWEDLDEAFNREAFAIATYMNPGLQKLDLLGNRMNNNGLEAILDRFSQLEYLDLRWCFNVDLKGDLLRKCQGITTLRLPHDSTEDFKFNVLFRRVLDDLLHIQQVR